MKNALKLLKIPALALIAALAVPSQVSLAAFGQEVWEHSGGENPVVCADDAVCALYCRERQNRYPSAREVGACAECRPGYERMPQCLSRGAEGGQCPCRRVISP